MPIQNVTSTLPDQRYIAALEKDRDNLWAEIVKLRTQLQEVQARR